MRLTRGQRAAVCAGAGLILIMVFFPPWRYSVMVKTVAAPPYEFRWCEQTKVDDIELVEGLCYSCVLSPPFELDASSRAYEPRIDLSRLAIQCLVALLGAGIAVLVLGQFGRGGAGQANGSTI